MAEGISSLKAAAAAFQGIPEYSSSSSLLDRMWYNRIVGSHTITLCVWWKMAKWGEGDPRWIVEERPDATNVNNWHWWVGEYHVLHVWTRSPRPHYFSFMYGDVGMNLVVPRAARVTDSEQTPKSLLWETVHRASSMRCAYLCTKDGTHVSEPQVNSTHSYNLYV